MDTFYPNSPTTHRAAIVIQSYVRMVSAQHQVLYALYQQSTSQLEQSFLNMLIHHSQEEYGNAALDSNIIHRHRTTRHHRTVESIHASTFVKQQDQRLHSEKLVDVQKVMQLFHRCLRQTLGQETYTRSTLKHLFARADADNDGYISRSELHAFFEHLDFCLTAAEVTVLFNWLDFDHDGSISIDEFINACSEQVTEQHSRTGTATTQGLEAESAMQARQTRDQRQTIDLFLQALGVGDLGEAQHQFQVWQKRTPIGTVHNLKGHNSWGPVHYACSAGSLDCVKWLVEVLECRCDATDRRGVTPAMVSARRGDVAICQYLHSWGADLIGSRSKSMLAAARRGECVDVVVWLAKMGVDVK